MKRTLSLAVFVASLGMTNAATADGIASTGTIVAIALPLAAASLSATKSDWVGIEQMLITTGLTVGTAYGLKQVIHEERPDKSDEKSFPSDTAALAFAPAAFLWDRYGWQYGVPAYIAAGFVGYSRVDADKHHWWDVAASAGIAFAYSKLITSEYRDSGFYSDAHATPDSAYVKAGYRW